MLRGVGVGYHFPWLNLVVVFAFVHVSSRLAGLRPAPGVKILYS